MTKYGAVRTNVDGFKFDSRLEANTYIELRRLHDKGTILNLSLQQPFQLYSRSGQVVCKYVADFVCELASKEVVVVEAKGMPTPVWRLKKKMFLADYPHLRLIEVNNTHQFPLKLDNSVCVSSSGRKKRSR